MPTCVKSPKIISPGTAKTRKARLQHSAPTVRDPTQPTSMVYVQYLEKTRKTDNKKKRTRNAQSCFM
ncbi:hypothetical protein WA026_019458 [Henosepilachna vigintioctopunctata]|uniref:Uncharacterized protein n=1 Tax=Henosepilachna vigintioctopunctata TaxID=420089 RepID=A0AAW1U5B6_9CUCU